MTNTAHPICSRAQAQTPAPTGGQTRFYDQALRQLELGETRNALLSLAGIFDGAIASGCNVTGWRESLLAHPLFEVLSVLEAAGDRTIAALGTNQAEASRQALTERAQTARAADHIFSTDSLDLLKPGAIAGEIAALGQRLSPGSRIFISSFVPGHLGLGWQRIFRGRTLHCHDEQALEIAASAAGLSIQHFRDASDCLIWAVLQHRTSNSH